MAQHSQSRFKVPMVGEHNLGSLMGLEGDKDYQGLSHYWDHAADTDEHAKTVAKEDDEKHFAVDLDVAHFRPQELKMRLDGRTLVLMGQQEKPGKQHRLPRSFDRMIQLPEGVVREDLISYLKDDGILHIEGPKRI